MLGRGHRHDGGGDSRPRKVNRTVGDARIRNTFQDAVRAGARRDYGEAIRLLEDVLSRSDDFPEALLYLGRARHACGEFGRAAASFTDYLNQHPKSAAVRLYLGRTYIAAGLPRRAIPILLEAEKRRPDDPSVAAMLALAYLKARNSAKAVQAFERAVQLAPADARVYRGYVNALLVRGIRLARSGDGDLAAQMLGFVVDNGADGVLARLELGRIHLEAGDPRSALAQYDRAVEFEPNDPQLRWYRASALMALNEAAAARDELEKIRTLGADVPDLQWNAQLVDRFMIAGLLSASRWRKAAAACSQWLKKFGSDPAIHAMYAEALRGLGEYETAENHARRAIAASRGEAGLHYGLLLLLWEKEDWRGLKAELPIARRLGCDEDVLVRFAALLASKTDPDDKTVVALVQEAIRRTGPAPELMFALASRYLRLGLTDLAEPWYRKTLAVAAGHERAALGLIAALERSAAEKAPGAKAKLFEAYEEYIAAFPSNKAIIREFALYLVKDRLYAKAIPQLETLLAWEPANRTLRRLLAYSYRKTERFRDAAVVLKSLLKEQPRDASSLLDLAHCLDKTGATAYSISLLKSAVDFFPALGTPALALGILLSRAGKAEEAAAAFREAAARAPDDPRPLRRLEALYRKSGIDEFAEKYAAEALRKEKK